MEWTAQTDPRDSEIKELMSRGRMDWTPQTAPWDSKIINALMSPVTHGLDSLNSP